jgi:hypothetical protein
LCYRKTYSIEVTDFNFQDKSPAEGLPVFDDGSFQKRWVSLSSFESALRLRYPFGDHYNFDKAMLSISLGKLHPRLIHRKTQMPTTYANNSEWIKVCQTDEKLLASYGGKVNREKNYDRHAKKKQNVVDEVFDDVDIFLANKISTHNTTICTNDNPPPQRAEEWRKLDDWDSGEAILLFNSIPGITTYATNTQ